MPDSVGTRTRQNLSRERADQGSDTRSHTRDLKMSKNVTSSATFTTDGKITGSNGDFSAFALNDTILVQNALLNNGFFTITALDGTNHAFVTVDPPPKAEGPLSVTIRTS